MRLVIKNSIQLCLRALVLSIVLRHSNYNNKIISIEGTFFWDILYRVYKKKRNLGISQEIDIVLKTKYFRRLGI